MMKGYKNAFDNSRGNSFLKKIKGYRIFKKVAMKKIR